VKVYYEIPPKVGMTRLWLHYAEKVIMKTKSSIIDPIGTASPDFSSGI
jgi:hypothetical protein